MTIGNSIDFMILQAIATEEEVVAAALEATSYGFASICVHPVWVKPVAQAIAGRGVRLTCMVGFPLGTNKPTMKAIEAASAMKDGADEVDVVALLPNLLLGDVGAAKHELMEIVRGTRAARRDAIIKVVVESNLLMMCDDPEEKVALACQAVRQSGADYIVTSSGFHAAGAASADAIRLLKKHAEGLLVKSAGGIEDLAIAQEMLKAGADRLGSNSGMKIVEEERRQQQA